WNVQAPVSEGIADRKYSFVPAFLLRELQRRNALLCSVGMGSRSMPYPRLLEALRWHVIEVPFFFHVCNVSRFLREAAAIRTTTIRRLLLDAGAATGLLALGIHALQAWRTRRPTEGRAEAEAVTSFGAWANDVWEAAKTDYRLCAVRGQAQ